jgi:8-oxo-dGTP pyrophosphatase MutT (NUDIX family)
MKDFSFVQKIQTALEKPLPGQEAQFKMAHSFRKEASGTIPGNAKEAAVMLLLFLKNDNWHTALIQRTMMENDQHSGQVSFPGGKKEASDSSYADCAKRETFEEIGVASELIQILGALTPLYIPVSNFQVFPFVGFLEEEPVWNKQMSEVSEIIHVPITHFLEKENKKITTVKGKGFSLENTPYFDVNGKVVWGATAMILSEFCEIQASFLDKI